MPIRFKTTQKDKKESIEDRLASETSETRAASEANAASEGSEGI